MSYIIYSKDNCVFCTKAKELLSRQGKDFIEYKLDKDFDRDTLLELFPQARTFPVITLDKEYLGGYNELCKSLNVKE
jgi:glutaredoxin